MYVGDTAGGTRWADWAAEQTETTWLNGSVGATACVLSVHSYFIKWRWWSYVHSSFKIVAAPPFVNIPIVSLPVGILPIQISDGGVLIRRQWPHPWKLNEVPRSERWSWRKRLWVLPKKQGAWSARKWTFRFFFFSIELDTGTKKPKIIIIITSIQWIPSPWRDHLFFFFSVLWEIEGVFASCILRHPGYSHG